MKDIANTIATALGMSFKYLRMHEANVSLDNETFPIVVMKEVEQGTITTKGNSLFTNNVYEVEFLQLADMQDTADNNDTIMVLMMAKAVSFARSISNHRSIEGGVSSYSWIKIKENVYVVNCIGVRLTFNAELVAANRCD